MLEFIKKKQELLYDSKIVALYKDYLETPKGNIVEYDYIKHKSGGGAGVLLVVENEYTYLVKQYRNSLDAVNIEIPAGGYSYNGEPGELCAIREAEEESGFIPEEIYSIGISGRIEGVDEEGNVRIRSKERVEISDVEMTSDGLVATAAICHDIDDITEKEEKQKFEKIKKELLGLSRQYQWGAMARNFILQWKNLNELAGALSPYMAITWEEKYEILENNSKKERSELIEKAVLELLEIFRVGEEAETVQKEKHESSYFSYRR